MRRARWESARDVYREASGDASTQESNAADALESSLAEKAPAAASAAATQALAYAALATSYRLDGLALLLLELLEPDPGE